MIRAKIIADSISESGDRITTWELDYPRFIHSELMTHRMFSRNAASSRAIPIKTTMDLVENSPAIPKVWGLNQPGMQAKAVHEDSELCECVWYKAAKRAVQSATELQELGLHKQIVNRVLEPFVHIKTVVTATEFGNWFHLRSHEHAQPEIQILSDKMLKWYEGSEPTLLKAGEWHTPYYMKGYWKADECEVLVFDEVLGHHRGNTLTEAQRISASCCAQVSYRKLDGSQEKADKIYDMLVTSERIHASPFEHIATPMEFSQEEFDECISGYTKGTMDGATHTDRDGYNWSGNLKGWIQYRQLIKDNYCSNFKGE